MLANGKRLFLRVHVKVCELGDVILARLVAWSDCKMQLE